MDTLSATFAALADPTRRAILARLAQGEATVNELAEPFAMSLPSVSRHLKVLEKAGLISQSRAAQQRPRRIQAASLREADAWMAQYRAFWEPRFDRLDNYLKSVVLVEEQGELSSPPAAPEKGKKTAGIEKAEEQ